MARRVWQCEGCKATGVVDTTMPCLNECGTECCDSCANYGNCSKCYQSVPECVQLDRWEKHSA